MSRQISNECSLRYLNLKGLKSYTLYDDRNIGLFFLFKNFIINIHSTQLKLYFSLILIAELSAWQMYHTSSISIEYNSNEQNKFMQRNLL